MVLGHVDNLCYALGVGVPRRHGPERAACRLGGLLLTVRGCLLSGSRMLGLDGWDAPRGSPSQTVRVGALFGAVVLCDEVELHAAVLFHAGAYGPFHYGCGQAGVARRGDRDAGPW